MKTFQVVIKQYNQTTDCAAVVDSFTFKGSLKDAQKLSLEKSSELDEDTLYIDIYLYGKFEDRIAAIKQPNMSFRSF